MKTIVFDTRLRKAVKPLLDVDPISVYRTPSVVDAEGVTSGGRVLVFNGFGTITDATDQEQMVAAERGTKIDKILAFERGLDIQGGDFITVDSETWEVVSVDKRRLFRRAILRETA